MFSPSSLRICPLLLHQKSMWLQSCSVNGLSFKPWLNWASDKNPTWWQSYNKVKHNRDAHFDEATLKNALNALGRY